jgi:thymidylate kinase
MKEPFMISKKEKDLLKLVLMDAYVNSQTCYYNSETEMMIDLYEKLQELFEEEN